MEVITFNFITSSDYKNHTLPGENEKKTKQKKTTTKKTNQMITTSMLRRQVSMTDDNKFNHIVKNSQRVLKINDQYENHPHVEEFTKGCSVMFIYGTYVLEGEADANFP